MECAALVVDGGLPGGMVSDRAERRLLPRLWGCDECVEGQNIYSQGLGARELAHFKFLTLIIKDFKFLHLIEML